MDTMYIGPFTAPEIDTIHRALQMRKENLDAILRHWGHPTKNHDYFLEEQNRIGRIIDRIEAVQLSQ